jgi:single-strand DNA-binding protein
MLQKLTIIGHLGGDPEMRYTKTGKAVTNFSVAVNDNQGNTTWFRVTTWERLAETTAEYLKKGKLVYCEGSVKASPWTDRRGDVQASLDMTAYTCKFLSPRDAEGSRQRPVATYTPDEVEEGNPPW